MDFFGQIRTVKRTIPAFSLVVLDFVGLYWTCCWCRRGDSNPHERRSPPPQDGVSANSTTSAYYKIFIPGGDKGNLRKPRTLRYIPSTKCSFTFCKLRFCLGRKPWFRGFRRLPKFMRFVRSEFNRTGAIPVSCLPELPAAVVPESV